MASRYSQYQRYLFKVVAVMAAQVRTGGSGTAFARACQGNPPPKMLLTQLMFTVHCMQGGRDAPLSQLVLLLNFNGYFGGV